MDHAMRGNLGKFVPDSLRSESTHLATSTATFCRAVRTLRDDRIVSKDAKLLDTRAISSEAFSFQIVRTVTR